MNSKILLEKYKTFLDEGKNYNYRKIGNNTYVVKTDDLLKRKIIGIQYHNTVIVGIREDGSYFINNGGWFSATTKQRINKFLREIGSNSSFYQRSHKWYCDGVPVDGTIAFDSENAVVSSSVTDCFAYSIPKLGGK